MMRSKKVKMLSMVGIMTAFALILSYIELLLPPLYSAIPGIKMGLANIAVIFALYRFSSRTATTVSVLRIILVSVLFGNAMAFAYSLSGAVLSLAAMTLLKKSGLLSGVGVSVAGAVMHNVGQILCAMALLGTAELGYYLILLAITGTISGIFVGLVGAIAITRIPEKITKI